MPGYCQIWQWSYVNNTQLCMHVSGNVSTSFEGNMIFTCVIFTVYVFAGSRPMIIYSTHRYIKSEQDAFLKDKEDSDISF